MLFTERLFETLATAQLHVDKLSLQVSRLVHQLSDDAVPRLSPEQEAAMDRINDPSDLDPSPLILHLRSAHYLGRDYACPFGPSNAYHNKHSPPSIVDSAQALHLLATDMSETNTAVERSLSRDIALLKGTVTASHTQLNDQFHMLQSQFPSSTTHTPICLNIMD